MFGVGSARFCECWHFLQSPSDCWVCSCPDVRFTLRTEFLDVQAKHAVAPIAFRETQRDFKRYAAVIAATAVEDVKVGDGEAFKDEKDLRSFMRWILRGAPGHKPTAPKA